MCAQLCACAQPQGRRSRSARCTDAVRGRGASVLVKVWAASSPTRGPGRCSTRPEDLQPAPAPTGARVLSPHSLLILPRRVASCGQHPSPLTAETAQTLSAYYGSICRFALSGRPALKESGSNERMIVERVQAKAPAFLLHSCNTESVNQHTRYNKRHLPPHSTPYQEP